MSELAVLRPLQTLVSVDLDDLTCYHAIHGLGPPHPGALGLVLERCLPRFLELFDDLGVRATFFVIGRDLARDLEGRGVGADLLQRALAAGHELANHSHGHAYDLVRWPRTAIAADLRACDRLLRQLGADPVGFRAPGYTHDDILLDEVAALGYRYDSSLLPSLAYWAVKRIAIIGIALRGSHSKSFPSGPAAFMGTRRPHRLPNGLWELPMSVSDWGHLPLIGTTLLSSSERVHRRLVRAALRQEHLHVELHGLDLADALADPFCEPLRHRLPELRVDLSVKQRRLRALLSARGPVTRLCDAVPPR